MGGSWKMGKNWHGNRGSKGGGHSSHDIPSCKGYPVIMGTCDAARERETSRELVNLLNDAIEALYPRPSAPHSDQADGHGKSIAEMMRAEIEEIKGQKHADTQSVVSINTGVKGIALIKILRKECCPVTLIKHLFERVRREKAALCRYVVRVIPLQRVFYPELEDLQTHFTLIMREALGIAAPAPETVAATPAEEEECAAPAPAADVPEAVVPEAGSKRPLTEDPDTSKEVKKPRTEEHVKFGYCIHYKARNNNILKKDDVHRLLAGCLSGYGYGDYKQPKVSACLCVRVRVCACAPYSSTR